MWGHIYYSLKKKEIIYVIFLFNKDVLKRERERNLINVHIVFLLSVKHFCCYCGGIRGRIETGLVVLVGSRVN